MALIFNVLSLFLLVLSFSLIVFLPVVKIQDTGTGFAKLILSISLASGLLSFGLSLFDGINLFVFPLVKGSFLLGLFLVGVNLTLLKDNLKWHNYFLYLLAILFLFLVVTGIFSTSFESLYFAYGTVIYLGSLVFAMILGHYYLVVPRLSEKPLLNLHYLFWLGMVLKLVMTVITIRSMELSYSLAEMWDLIFVLMRVLWGYVALLVLSYYSYRLSKMRSTQSATGVLYVMVFFVLVGELISFYYFVSENLFL